MCFGMALRWEKPKRTQMLLSLVLMGSGAAVWNRDGFLGSLLCLVPIVAYVTGLRPSAAPEEAEEAASSEEIAKKASRSPKKAA